MSDTFRLPELADAAGVTPRTVRYYIAQGLLPSPGRLGPNTRYGREHLDRLHRIRRLQEEGLPLARIRELLEPQPAHIPGPLLAEATLPPMEPPMSMLRAIKPRPAAPLPASVGRTVWERIALTPDVELSVRKPHARDTAALVEALVRHARRG